MGLNWNWSDKIGTLEAEVDVINLKTGEDGKEMHTFNLYQGNALLIAIDEYTENGKDMYNLYTFFADENHLKNMLGMNKKQGYSENVLAGWGWKKIKINTRKYTPARGWRPEIGKLVDILLKGLPDLNIELYAE